jgi:uncharacterized cupredoxin-like copper-binding protein
MKPNTFANALIALATFSVGLTSLLAQAHGGDSAGDEVGQPGKPELVNRTFKVEMRDNMRFFPDKIRVKKGETVLLLIHNDGALKHEFVLGTEKALNEHNEYMKLHPDMEHDDESMVTVKPGETAELVWQFTHSGTVQFACLQPGHYAAGMKGRVSVAGSGGKHESHKQ